MRVKRKCKSCGKEFIAIKSTQFYCSRRCFKRDYYLKQKIKEQEENQNAIHPYKKCPFCGVVTELDFDPIKKPKLFDNWACPACGVTNKIIWEFQNKKNSRELIKNKIKTIKQVSTKKTKYHIYNIPIRYPEQGNSNILTLACSIIDMSAIKKLDRKKVTFS